MAENEELGKRIVCIIDDNEDIREIYSAKFTSEGFMVVSASNGEEGLQVIREKRPDVILLDIEMPVLDGIGVLEVLKEDAELSKIPVVILSNIDRDEMFQEIERLGAAKYYLVKSLTSPQKVVDMTVEVLTSQA